MFPDETLEPDVQFETEFLESDLISIDKALPGQLYIIPIRFRPIFPGIVTPLIISAGRFAESIEKIISSSMTVGLVLLRDDDAAEIRMADLYSFGTAAKVLKKINLPDGGINVLINSVKRFRILDTVSEKKHLIANVEYLDDCDFRRNVELKALTRAVLSQLKMLSENNPLFTEEMKLTMVNVEEPGKIADFVTSILNLEKHEYQDILETLSVKKRLEKVLRLLNKEMEVLNIQKKIQNQINEKIDKQQREFFLREQLKIIRSELGLDEDEKNREIREMRKRAEALQLVGEVKEKVEEEIEKLGMIDPNSSEYAITRNYVETILSLPWNIKTEDIIDLHRAEKILEKDHYGLDDVKKRILEFLAVRKLKSDARGSIICLIGPPGVGKTSLGRSIARALGKKFFRASLGGMRDEAEIKGHRRTYVGAMPGKIIQGLKICKSRNPVFMLDEIDKLGQSFQGDPASALLEVLDPEQNKEFRDHYLDVPFDLSDVLFITTANTLDTIPRVLADRMEIIRLSGYIAEEKYHIAKKYLIPRQLERHGLVKGDVRINKDGIMFIIHSYAREAGVRNLERQIERICRKTALLKLKKQKLHGKYLSREQIKAYLGPELYFEDEIDSILRPGIAVGLAWTEFGGTTLTVESIAIAGGKDGRLTLTGQLGDVMSESANIAYSYIRYYLNGDEKASAVFKDNIIHLHVPAGATPKDGPSAGITMASSIFSLITGKVMKRKMAMTGELTLSGRVLPVGGIKEKVIAARRAKLTNVILPYENQKDIDDIPQYIRKGMTFYFVKEMDEVISIAFEGHAKRICTRKS
ncbi:MAG: endopeptidase La [Spirochaetes bacterium]|nr:endopeptidase La [Spirochaetota bacterium]